MAPGGRVPPGYRPAVSAGSDVVAWGGADCVPDAPCKYGWTGRNDGAFFRPA